MPTKRRIDGVYRKPAPKRKLRRLSWFVSKRFFTIAPAAISLLIVAGLFSTIFLRATAVGPNAPGTTADDATVGTVAWTTPANVVSSNNTYATMSLADAVVGHYVKATNFGFSIPAGSIIDGITVEVERKEGNLAAKGNIVDNSIKIVKGGTITGTDLATATAWPTADAFATYGGATNLWGTTWAATDINATTFGVAVSAKNVRASNPGGTESANIDFIRITINYSPPPSITQSGYRWLSNTNSAEPSTVQWVEYASFSDIPRAITNDGAGGNVYIASSTSIAGTNAWYIEKRNMSTGAPVTAFGTSGGILESATGGEPTAVAVDSSYLYIVGRKGSDDTWTVEKRDITTGALISGFGTGGEISENVVSGGEQVSAIALDTSGGHMYIAGGASASTTADMRIEKRLLSTGALVSGFGAGGILTQSPTTGDDEWNAIVLDVAGGNLYVGGYTTASIGNSTARVEKRSMTTGGVVSAFGTTGVVTSNPSTLGDEVRSLAVDTTNGVILMGGFTTDAGTNLVWRTEERNSTNGTAISGFGASGSITGTAPFNPSTNNITNIQLDGSGNYYTAGIYSDATSFQTIFRTEKRTVATGSLVSGWGSGGIISQATPTVSPKAMTLNVSSGLLINIGYSSAGLMMQKYNTSTGVDSFATALAGINTAAVAPSILPNVARLRLLLHTAANNLPSGSSFKLQFATRSGTCAATTTGYSDVATGSGAIRYYDNSIPSNGNATSTSTLDPTHSTDTVLPQTYVESNNFSSTSALAIGQDGEWDFVLDASNAPGSTTYCFRAVDSTGASLATYSQTPELTTPTATLGPNVPSSPTQKKTDNTTVTTGSWISSTSVKFTADVSDLDASDTDALCVEARPITSAFTGTETLCGTGVPYSGTAVPASVTLTGLTDTTEYHWQARVKDAVGHYSTWVSYGGNSDTLTAARDFGLDTTAPSGGIVYDGTSVGVDAVYNTGSLTTLSANWSGVSTTVSGLGGYEYSVGTSAGATDTFGWTSNGTTASVTIGGLTLRANQKYFVNVRTSDNAGNTSVISSDGQLVPPTLSFGVSVSTINFNHLNASNGFADSQTVTLTTTTNAYGGYKVRTYATDLLRGGTSTIPFYSNGTYASPTAWSLGMIGFGYTSNDANITSGGTSGFCSATCYAPISQTAPGDVIADSDVSQESGQAFTITYKVATSGAQKANNYVTTLIYSATPIY